MTAATSTLLRACQLLEAGNASEARELIAGDHTPAGTAVGSVAAGLLAVSAGQDSSAEKHFDEAFALGVPAPAVLRHCARFYQHSGRHERAYECYCLLNAIEPGALREFKDSLPSSMIARYAPVFMASVRNAERPRHWFYPPVKRALVDMMGVEGATFAFFRMLGNRSGGVRKLPLRGLGECAREQAIEFEELSPGTPITMPPTPVFEAGAQTGIETRSRDFFRCVLRDVVVSSKSNFLITSDCAVLDYQAGELAKVPVDISTDPILMDAQQEFAVGGMEVTLGIEAGGTTQSLEQAFTLVGVNSYNYGHWLLEFLPRIWACQNRPEFSSLPVIVDAQMPPQNLEALRLFLGPEHPVHVLERGQAIKVQRLWTCSTVVYIPLAPAWETVAEPDLMAMDGARLAGLIHRVRDRFESVTPGNPERIYLTRKDSQHRRMVNRTEVESWFASQGFEIYDFGELSFRKQLELVRGARIIVGPDGSSLMTTFFAGPATSIGVLDNPYVEDNEWYTSLCAALDQHLLYLTGEVTKEDSAYRFRAQFRIDVSRLPTFLEALETPP